MAQLDGRRTLYSRWPRFSLRVFLLVIAAVAALLWLLQAWSYVHPAHKFPAYEKAPYTSRLQKEIGPNTIRIRSIARNRYDGKIHLIRQSGLSQEIPNPQQLKGCAKWLDVVQFEITPGPDLAEILEVRVFDHETRDMLRDGYGWQVVEPNLVQVYGFGNEVPEKLDLWFRLNSHQDNVVYKLPPTKGASVKLPERTLSVSDVTDGYVGWSAQAGFSPPQAGSMDSAVQIDLHSGKSRWVDYQVTTVSKSGEKEFESYSLWPQGVHAGKRIVSSHFPLAKIDHYEVRPFGGRHRFFFDGIEVPPPAGRKFDPPPVAIIKTNQGECEGVLPEFDPLLMHFQVEKGSNISGSSARDSSAWILRNGPQVGIDEQFSVILRLRGTKDLPLGIRLQDTEGAWSKPGSSSTFSANSGNYKVSADLYRVPLDDVQAIEVTASLP